MKRVSAAALLAVALLAPGAGAESYLLLIYETEADIALRNDKGPRGGDYWAAWTAYSEALAKAGAIRGGAPLLPGSEARFGASEASALALGGYFMIEAESREAAERLAAAAPSVARGGAVTLASQAPSMAMPSN